MREEARIEWAAMIGASLMTELRGCGRKITREGETQTGHITDLEGTKVMGKNRKKKNSGKAYP